MKKICWICGGSGAFTGLRGICMQDDMELTVLTTTCDSGGAQGVILAGDPRAVALADPMKCLVALATDGITARLYRTRPFENHSGMHGAPEERQTVGNVVWYGLQKMGMSPREAIAYMASDLKVRPSHHVEPVAVERANLCVRLEDGSVIRGEALIDIPIHDGNLRIREAWLEPAVTTTPQVMKAITEADLVIIGPGDLYSSLVGCLLPGGVQEALRHTRARLLYVVNLMTKWGETTDFKASDFVKVVERYAGRRMDHVIVNSANPSPEVLRRYTAERASSVDNDLDGERRVIGMNLLDCAGGVVRHRADGLAIVIGTLASARSVLPAPDVRMPIAP